MEKLIVDKRIPQSQLEKLYKEERDPWIKERLLAIINLYEGKTSEEVALMIRKSQRTLRRWINGWNREGYEGLLPHFTGGPKPKMPKDEWDKIIEEIKNKGMDLKDVTLYVKDTRGVEYSYKSVWRILRSEKGVRYGKPLIRNSRRPKDAEHTLKKNK